MITSILAPRFFRTILCLLFCICFSPVSSSLVMMDVSSKPGHRNALVQELRMATGLWLEFQGDFLRVSFFGLPPFFIRVPGFLFEQPSRKSSPTARQLMLDAMSSSTLYRVRSSRDTTLARAGSSIDLDFRDLASVTYRDMPRIAFGAGMLFLHELAHRHRGLVDPNLGSMKTDPEIKGDTVEFVNRIQKELGLPERLHYFPKQIPARNDIFCIFFENGRVEIDAKLF